MPICLKNKHILRGIAANLPRLRHLQIYRQFHNPLFLKRPISPKLRQLRHDMTELKGLCRFDFGKDRVKDEDQLRECVWDC